MKEAEMRVVAQIIDRVLQAPEDPAVLQQAIGEVRTLTARFPLYPNRWK
jgi:glycine hydroxymethyltransferase